MDLTCSYLGFDLAHPYVPGASPMVDDLDTVRRLEDAGAPLIVMHSLFEEQLLGEELATHAHFEGQSESFAEALSYLPEPDTFALGPEEYLEQIRRIKAAVSVPVVASLNGSTLGGWLEYAKKMELAGADALELNAYQLVTDFEESGAQVEDRMVEMLTTVRAEVEIPIAVKLSPFHTSLPHLSRRLHAAGAEALVLFNRFYQPDLDVEELEVSRQLHLSDSSELNLRLRWLAILSGRLEVGLAASGGVHEPIDGVKAVLCGADVVQVVSVLLLQGPQHLALLRKRTAEWLEEHEYGSLAQARGSMNLLRCPDPHAFERANYVRLLQSWRAELGLS